MVVGETGETENKQARRAGVVHFKVSSSATRQERGGLAGPTQPGPHPRIQSVFPTGYDPNRMRRGAATRPVQWRPRVKWWS